MANVIEKYYMEDGQPKVVMTQNAAKEVKAVIEGFRAGIGQSSFSKKIQQLRIGEHVADEFLKDTVSWSLAQEKVETDDGTILGPIMFLQTVEKKIKDLVG